MRFPRSWAVWKVALLAAAWVLVIFGVALALTIRNVDKLVMADETTIGLSIFAEGWPPWVPLLAWVPAVALLIWRIALPPRAGRVSSTDRGVSMRSLALAALAAAALPGTLRAQETRDPRLLEHPVRYYPQAYLDAPATVVLQFVVGTDGRVDSTSIHVIRATNPHFTDAARLTAMALRFDPARSKGALVKTLVQQPIAFMPLTQACQVTVLAPDGLVCVDSTATAGRP